MLRYTRKEIAMKKEEKINVWDNLPPALTKEQDLELLKEYHTYGDKAVRDKLFEGNLRFVAYFVTKYCEKYLHLQSNVYPAKEDLLQEGAYALVKAIENYNIEYPFSFATYLGRVIHRTIHRFVAHSDKSVRTKISLNQFVAYDDEKELQEFIEDESADIKSIDSKIDLDYIKEKILPKLPERYAEVFRGYFFEGKTLQFMAYEKDLTREAMRQNLEKAQAMVKLIYNQGFNHNNFADEDMIDFFGNHVGKRKIRNRAIINRYGKDFFENYFFPRLPDKQKLIFDAVFMQDSSETVSDIARRLNMDVKPFTAGLQVIYRKIQNSADKMYKRYIDEKAGIRKPDEKKTYKGITKRQQAINRVHRFIDEIGGADFIRKYFYTILNEDEKVVFENSILGYNGESSKALIKKCGINERRYYYARRKALEKLENTDFEYLVSLVDNGEVLKAQESFVVNMETRIGGLNKSGDNRIRKNRAIFKQYDRDFLENYLPYRLTPSQRKIYQVYILDYKGQKFKDLNEKYGIKSPSYALDKIETKIGEHYQSYLAGKVDKDSEKRKATISLSKTKAKKQKYASIISSLGGAEVIRKYFEPTLNKREVDVLENGVLNYNGESSEELAEKCEINTAYYKIILCHVLKKLRTADFADLKTKIDSGEKVQPGRADRVANKEINKFMQDYGEEFMRKYFAPILPNKQQQFFEEFYLDKKFASLKDYAISKQKNFNSVYMLEKVIAEKLRDTPKEELVAISEKAEKKTEKAMAKEPRAYHISKRQEIIAEYGGREFLEDVFIPTLGIPAYQIIFEDYVLNNRPKQEIIQKLKLNEKTHYVDNVYQILKGKLKEFKESFGNFEGAVKYYYAQKEFEKAHPEDFEKLALGVKSQSEQKDKEK